MGAAEGIPNDDAGLLRRSLDGTPAAGVITFDSDLLILQSSGPAIDKAPTLVPGVNLREELEKLTHVEMVDRLLIRREVATFPGTRGAQEAHWMIWSESTTHDEIVMSVWDTDWSEVMNERRAAFTMAASHEMRGPLTTLQGFAEILNMDTSNLTPEQVEATTIIETTARHLAVLVEDVFDLSRNSFGELRLDFSEVDLEDLVNTMIPVLRPRVEARDQQLFCEVEPGLPRIHGDSARTRQMISNLVNNASIHNPEGTRIDVTVRLMGDRIAIEVRDDGQGLPFIDPEDSLRTFRRGATATVGDRTGSGIGLSVTRSLIQLHRGKILVESEPGEGSVFTLLFPVDFDTPLGLGEQGPV